MSKSKKSLRKYWNQVQVSLFIFVVVGLALFQKFHSETRVSREPAFEISSTEKSTIETNKAPKSQVLRLSGLSKVGISQSRLSYQTTQKQVRFERIHFKKDLPKSEGSKLLEIKTLEQYHEETKEWVNVPLLKNSFGEVIGSSYFELKSGENRFKATYKAPYQKGKRGIATTPESISEIKIKVP